jgi:type IV pilus assembly protein PilY1
MKLRELKQTRLAKRVKEVAYTVSAVTSITLLSTAALLPQQAQASDVEVYLQGGDFNKRVMLLVDQSRSMGGAGLLDLVKDYPLCIGGGVTGLLGEGGLNLGIKVAGSDQVDGILTNLLGLVDKAVLQTALGGTLDPLLSVTAEKPNTQYPFTRNHCTLVATDLVVDLLDGLLKPILGATGLSAKQYIEETCDLQLDVALLKPVLGRSTLGLYRCYDKNSRVRMALTDLLKEKDPLGNYKLSDKVAVGLAVSPYDHTKNDRAGAVISEPKYLNEKYVWSVNGSESLSHREHLLKYIASDNMNSKGEFNLQNLLKIVPKLVGSLLTDVLTLVLNILKDPLSAVTNLLKLENTNNALNEVLTLLGLGGNNPMASAYAETGAYLLGNTTKGTGARQVAKKEALLGVLGLSIWLDYQCQDWESDNSTCKTWDYKPGVVPTAGYKEIDANILNVLGILSVGRQKMYYEYVPTVDTKYSGFSNSAPATKKITNTNFYDPPSKQPQCDANGVVVIAGGVPSISPTLIDALLLPKGSQSDATKYGLERLMGRSLDSTQSLAIKLSDGGNATNREWAFQCNSNDLKRTILGQENTDFSAWQCIGAYARDIRALKENPIQTAVIGIDRSFLQLPTQIGGQPNFNQQQGLAQIDAIQGMSDSLLTAFLPKVLRDILGGLGTTLDALLPNSIIGSGLTNSITSLLDQLLPKNPEDIKNMARWGVIGGGGWYNASNTENIKNSVQGFSDNLGIKGYDNFLGNPIIPTDPLTPYTLKNDVYQNMFIPTDKQSWIGNLKKYTVVDGQTIQTKTIKDQWSSQNLTTDNILQGGIVDKLGLATATATPTRVVYSNRECDTKSSNTPKYQQALSLTQITHTYYQAKCGSDLDPYRQEFMALLGYQIKIQQATNQNSTNTSTITESLAVDSTARKMGMSLHSTPLKITQNAKMQNGAIQTRKVTVGGASVVEEDRDDYVVFGSTQGMLHVVDANSNTGGNEVFTFIPNEMLENPNQRRAITGNGLLTHAYFTDMQYGIDGQWSAYTEYVWDRETGRVTVGKATDNAKCDEQGQCGKQYLYGGLRMGGRSYYALDLSDLTKPDIKFHINPASSQVINKAGAKTYAALTYMGQSWSKPTLAHVIWQGQKKLVMFVGGGYDAGGDDGNSNKGGYEKADYMQTNKKGAGVYMFDAENGSLLWTASANVNTSKTGTENQSLKTTMQHSVVSRINAIDRNSDGIVDHLYFGDLGGQLWRVDINNALDLDKTFATATHIFDINQQNLEATYFPSKRFFEAPIFSIYGHGRSTLAVLSIATSNRSLPISDKSAGTVFNIFDDQVTKSTVATTDISSRGLVNYDSLPKSGSLTLQNRPAYGWYMQLNNGLKVMDEMALVNKSLYASIYDPAGGTTVSCNAGVKGVSSVYRYCLPYGVCEIGNSITKTADALQIGKGILPVTIGAGSTAGTPARQVIGGNNRATSKNVSQEQIIRRQIVPLKWYEKNE